MTAWQKGSLSGNGGCFEVSRDLSGQVLIRNSNRPDEWISDTAEAWNALAQGIRDGEFDHLTPNPVTRAELHREIARLSVEVEKLRAALRHPSSRLRAEKSSS